MQLPRGRAPGRGGRDRGPGRRGSASATASCATVREPAGAASRSEWAPGEYRVRARAIVRRRRAPWTPRRCCCARGSRRGCRRLGPDFTCHPALILVGGARPADHQRRAGTPRASSGPRRAEGFVLETCMYFPFTTAKNLTGFGAEHSRSDAAHSPAADDPGAGLRQGARRRTASRSTARASRWCTTASPTRSSTLLVRATRAAARIFFAAGARAGARAVRRPAAHRGGRGRPARRADHPRGTSSSGKVSISAAHSWAAAGMGTRPRRLGDRRLGPGARPALAVRGRREPLPRCRSRSTPTSRSWRSPTGWPRGCARGCRSCTPHEASPARELVVQALEDEGIRFAFGIPGTHNIELYDALAASERSRPVLVTDEQSAVVHGRRRLARVGPVGCVNLVPGAGLTHALSGDRRGVHGRRADAGARLRHPHATPAGRTSSTTSTSSRWPRR